MTQSADLRELAAGLRAQADALPAALDEVAAHSGPDVWRGPASERFAQELQEQRRRLRALADELMLAARRCAADAVALEATGAPLRVPPRFS